MGRLSGKVAVVTGGNSGIGFDTAKDFAEEGAAVMITGRNKDLVEKAAEELKTIGLVADQSDLKQLDELVEQIKQNHQKVDVLFLNAGVSLFAPIESVDEALFDNIIDTNLKGTFFMLQKMIPLLAEGGSVIVLSSMGAVSGPPNSAVYTASKAALNAIAKVAATEVAPKNIRVNTVMPGPIDTPLFSKVGLPEEAIAGLKDMWKGKIPLHRVGTSPEVAKLVTFLASDDASFVNGSDYLVDGGVNVITYQ
jgi:NAD(P)-dependent dehydrogenase (short-subunit alcohol dehydrogenase family)